MRPTVEIAFDLSLAGAGDFFTLGDTVQGVIGGTAFPLAGDVLTDVTDDVRSVSIKRGRSRELDRFTAGQAQVVVDNRNRDYDPSRIPDVGVRQNLLTNPSLETVLTPWVAGPDTTADHVASPSYTFTGAARLQRSTVGTAQLFASGVTDIAATAGLPYAFSAHVASNFPRLARVTLNFYDAGSVLLDSVSSALSATSAEFSRLFATSVAPVDTAFVRGSVEFLDVLVYDVFTLGDPLRGLIGSPDFPLADDFTEFHYVDGGLLEQSDELVIYYDGDTDVVGRIISAEWDGTPYASTSTLNWFIPGTGSLFALSIIPRKAFSVSFNGQPIYTGQVEDIDLSYDLSSDSTTIFKASDAFTLLAPRVLAPGTAVVESPGDRINSVLSSPEVNWPPARRNIDEGLTTLGTDVVGENTNALTYLQTIEQSEPGAFFTAKDGLLTFRSRSSLQRATNTRFTDDGTGLPFSDIELEYGTESLYTVVNVEYINSGTAPSPGTATAVNTVAQVDYGIIDYTVKTLLDGGTQAQELADFYSQRYSTPTLRINSLQVDVEALTPSQFSQLLALELGDGCEIVFTPNGIGDPLTRFVSIDGISHEITPAKHTVRLDFSESISGFILGGSIIGSGRLGF
jgi:hypothetical protein